MVQDFAHSGLRQKFNILGYPQENFKENLWSASTKFHFSIETPIFRLENKRAEIQLHL